MIGLTHDRNGSISTKLKVSTTTPLSLRNSPSKRTSPIGRVGPRRYNYSRGPSEYSRVKELHALDILDAKLLGPPRQEFVKFRFGGPDNLVLKHLYQPLH